MINQLKINNDTVFFVYSKLREREILKQIKNPRITKGFIDQIVIDSKNLRTNEFLNYCFYLPWVDDYENSLKLRTENKQYHIINGKDGLDPISGISANLNISIIEQINKNSKMRCGVTINDLDTIHGIAKTLGITKSGRTYNFTELEQRPVNIYRQSYNGQRVLGIGFSTM